MRRVFFRQNERNIKTMFKSIKVMLLPNNKQRTKLFQCFGVSRFAYNWALNRQQENYKNGGKFISAFDLIKEFTQLKKLPEYGWLNSYSSEIPNRAISVCGTVKSDLKLSDRVFICPECGNRMDRDLNASINLKNYGLSALK